MAYAILGLVEHNRISQLSMYQAFYPRWTFGRYQARHSGLAIYSSIEYRAFMYKQYLSILGIKILKLNIVYQESNIKP